MPLSNYDYYEIARAQWMSAERHYHEAATFLARAHDARNEAWEKLTKYAELLSPEEQARAVEQQFPANEARKIEGKL